MLLHKLQVHDLHFNVIRWIHRFLLNHNFVDFSPGSASGEISQGSVIGTSLLLICINDLHNGNVLIIAADE